MHNFHHHFIFNAQETLICKLLSFMMWICYYCWAIPEYNTEQCGSGEKENEAWDTGNIKQKNKTRNGCNDALNTHYCDVIVGTMASQITSLNIVYSTVYSGTDQRKHQSSTPLAFVRGIHRGSVNSPHKGPVTRKMLPFDDVIMKIYWLFIQPLASADLYSVRKPRR